MTLTCMRKHTHGVAAMMPLINDIRKNKLLSWLPFLPPPDSYRAYCLQGCHERERNCLVSRRAPAVTTPPTGCAVSSFISHLDSQTTLSYLLYSLSFCWLSLWLVFSIQFTIVKSLQERFEMTTRLGISQPHCIFIKML